MAIKEAIYYCAVLMAVFIFPVCTYIVDRILQVFFFFIFFFLQEYIYICMEYWCVLADCPGENQEFFFHIRMDSSTYFSDILILWPWFETFDLSMTFCILHTLVITFFFSFLSFLYIFFSFISFVKCTWVCE